MKNPAILLSVVFASIMVCLMSCGENSERFSRFSEDSNQWCENQYSTVEEINANCYADWKTWYWDPKKGLLPLISFGGSSTDEGEVRVTIYSISPEAGKWSDAASRAAQQKFEQRMKEQAQNAIERFGSREFLDENRNQFLRNKGFVGDITVKASQHTAKSKESATKFGVDLSSELKGSMTTVPADSNYPYITSKESEFGRELLNASRYKDFVAEQVEKGPESQKGIGRALISLATDALGQADSSSVAGDKDGAEFAKSIALGSLDLAFGLIPGLGLAKDIYEARYGINLVTGEKLTDLDKTMAFIGIITFGYGSKLALAGKAATLFAIFKAGAKDAEALNDLSKSLQKAEEIAEAAQKIGMKGPVDVKSFADVAEKMGKSADDLADSVRSGQGLIGRDFENHLVEKLGGQGSFRVGGREFDGKLGNAWYEAKSGGYWSKLDSPNNPTIADFRSDMGDRLSIATRSGASYHLFSNTPIRQDAKDYLVKKGITFVELLEQ